MTKMPVAPPVRSKRSKLVEPVRVGQTDRTSLSSLPRTHAPELPRQRGHLHRRWHRLASSGRLRRRACYQNARLSPLYNLTEPIQFSLSRGRAQPNPKLGFRVAPPSLRRSGCPVARPRVSSPLLGDWGRAARALLPWSSSRQCCSRLRPLRALLHGPR